MKHNHLVESTHKSHRYTSQGRQLNNILDERQIHELHHNDEVDEKKTSAESNENVPP
jgi:hypothetical protein